MAYGNGKPSRLSPMSLGFNHNRKHRMTTLPGSINAIVVQPTPRRRSPRMPLLPRSKTEEPTALGMTPSKVPASPSLREVMTSAAPTSKRASSASAPSAPSAPSDAVHWVYGTVESELLDEDGVVLDVSAGTRVFLEYPMRSDPDTGVVSMRCKRVHPRTAQLSYTWVRVYDPTLERRYVTSFSV